MAALLAACSFFGCNDDESIAPENQIGVSVTAEDLATKGSAITTESISQFGVDGFLTQAVAGKETHYVNNGEVNKTATGWSPVYKSGTTEAYAWPSPAVAFWAHAPYSQAVTFAEDFSSMSFSYALQNSDDETDAELQQDVAVAYTEASYADTEAEGYEPGKGMVNFTFGHALAGIRLDITNLEAGWEVEKMTLSGIYAGGTCTVTPTTSGLSFAWTLRTEETGTYSQKLTSGDFETVTTIGEGDVAVTSVRLKESTGKVFFIPPQTFPANAKLILTLSKGSRTVEVSADIAGKIVAVSNMYTYNVTVADRFESITLNGEALEWTATPVNVATDNTPQATQFAVTGDGIENVYEKHNAPENKSYRQTWILWGNTATVSFKVFSPVEGTYEIKPFVKKSNGTIVEGSDGFKVTFTIGGLTGNIGDADHHEATKVEFTVKANGAADGDQLFFKTFAKEKGENGTVHSLDSETQLYDMRGYHYFMDNDPLGD